MKLCHNCGITHPLTRVCAYGTLHSGLGNPSDWQLEKDNYDRVIIYTNVKDKS